MDNGELRDFTGAIAKGHAPETPSGAISAFYPVETPIECYLAGMRIRSFEDKGCPQGWHPFVCLYDRWGHILKQWPDNYIPSLDEIRQAVKEFAWKEGRRI